MKTKNEIINFIGAVIYEISLYQITPDQVTPETKIIQDLGLDSMDYATVMLRVEQWLDVKVPEDKINWAEIQTVEQLVIVFESTLSV